MRARAPLDTANQAVAKTNGAHPGDLAGYSQVVELQDARRVEPSKVGDGKQ